MLKVKRQRLSIKRISSRIELSTIDHAHAANEAKVTETVTTAEEGKKDTGEVEIEQGASNLSSEPKVVQRQTATGILAPVHFLRACSLCQRGLGPGHDTFIYRGEFAFCSRECRQQMIAKEENRYKFERWLQTLLRSYSPLAVEAPGFEFNLQI